MRSAASSSAKAAVLASAKRWVVGVTSTSALLFFGGGDAFYAGKISGVGQAADTYHVQYDDGDRELNAPRALLAPRG